MSAIEIKPKRKPIGFREKIAFSLVRLANKIMPENEAVLAFWMQQIQESFIEQLVHGTTITRTDPKDFFRKPKDLH